MVNESVAYVIDDSCTLYVSRRFVITIPSSLQRRKLLAPPIEMLLRSCPERPYLLLVISVTGVISMAIDNLTRSAPS